MSGRGRLALCAYAATVMAACSMLPLVDPASWILQAAFLLAILSGVGALARRVPLARPLTVLAQAVVALLVLTLVFARQQAIGGVLPGPEAFEQLNSLLQQGASDVGQYAIPAPATPGIRLMMVGGVLIIGLAVDALAVTFRSAAPAGLPLLALYSVAAGLSAGGASWLWFVLAAAGYLLLLLAEGRDRLSQWGRVFGGAARAPGRPQQSVFENNAPLAPVRTGRRIGVLALGIALVIPAMLPALDSGLLGGAGGGGGGDGAGGTISAVNPLVSLQNSLNQPEDREVMRYNTNAQDTKEMYLRIVALDEFDGASWKSSERHIKDVPDPLPRPDGLSPAVATTEVQTSISAAGWYAQSWLPMPFPATRVNIKGDWRFEPVGRTLVGDRKQTTRGAQYTVSSLLVRPTAAQLADAPRPSADLLKEYTRVPDSLPSVVSATAREVTSGAANYYEKAVKLQDWFSTSGGFTYNTHVQSGSGTEAIANFLKEKEGFCVHFSFSMAAMARTLGIPARVAVGFTPGAARPDGTMSVGLRDAHAWPELYFEGVGWTRFEPTPTRGSVPDYTRQQAPAGGPSSPAAPSTRASAQPSAAPSAPDSCPPSARRLGDCGPSAAAGVAGPTDSGPSASALVGTALGVAALLVLPLLPLLWRRRVRARRLGSGGRTPADAVARTLAAWQEITDTAWDYGIPPDDSQTPRKAAARVVRLGRLDGPAAESVHRAAGAVEQVLYAPEPRPTPGLADDVTRVAAGLRAAAGRWLSLRAILAPRSAVRVIWSLSQRWERTRAGVAVRTRALAERLRPGRRKEAPPEPAPGT
ncbi:transglutaminaseTgpA domain-containing protein [Streptomyces sp. WM6378]|uniref:transglutaminaseTgpA domain-containing protein n=1 Tax=Streptomyces sp. WM6378 TaxID=1415557 RepID=UPI0006AFB552|nr:transglutaminaseTgpA domain-containing protein [Streptomyces sp. WM6378]KOU40073.1 transglutaminase [Streptomyces sp. WM6378]